VVSGGLIVRDKTGDPTGQSDLFLTGRDLFPLLSQPGVFVDNAMDLIDKPEPTEDETLEMFDTTMRDALRVGLTNIQDAFSLPSHITFFQRHVLLS
jgi:hypothetical protein